MVRRSRQGQTNRITRRRREDLPAIGAICRECLHVVEWLRAEEVWKYPEPDDLDAMMRGLKRWEDEECTPLHPDRKELSVAPQ